MEYKSAQEFTQEISDRIVTGISGVFGNVDDVADVIHPGAFVKTLQENGSRLRHLWNHDEMQPPTAAIREVREVGRDQLPAEIRVKYPEAKGGLLTRREYLDTPRGNEILTALKAGALNEMSIGHTPVRKEYKALSEPMLTTTGYHNRVRHLYETKLFETSDVLWGANAATRSIKGLLPFHDTPKADKGMAWDGPAQVAKADTNDLKAMCAWVDSENEDTKSGYKLPHHEADGDHAVVWAGVRAAMGALMGARGGVDIPAGDRRGVYDHLAKHYAQFDEQPPEYKFLELRLTVADARALLGAGVEFKAGRMISAVNQAKIKDVIDAIENQLQTLEDLLGAAEPPAEESKALTDRNRALLTQLAERLIDIQIQ